MEFEHYSWRICVTAFYLIIYDILLPRGMFLLILNVNSQRKNQTSSWHYRRYGHSARGYTIQRPRLGMDDFSLIQYPFRVEQKHLKCEFSLRHNNSVLFQTLRSWFQPAPTFLRYSTLLNFLSLYQPMKYRKKTPLDLRNQLTLYFAPILQTCVFWRLSLLRPWIGVCVCVCHNVCDNSMSRIVCMIGSSSKMAMRMTGVANLVHRVCMQVQVPLSLLYLTRQVKFIWYTATMPSHHLYMYTICKGHGLIVF
jgi:hypothetical protein